MVGAGPAGLATAALQRRRGVRAIVFDRAERVGSSWAERYDSLRLNTVRWMSDLPGLRMERSLGRWVGRDDLVDYFERYAAHHRLECVLGADGTVDRVDPDGDGWTVVRDGVAHRYSAAVVATGHSQQATTPTWPGRDRFGGRLLHAVDYRRPDDFAGDRVLVVGAGSSGGEICVDLARAGVDVTWAVRTAPQVFPREVVGVPSTPFAPPAEVLPDHVVDRAAPWLERRVYGPRDYLPEPEAPMMELLAECKEPMTADGIVELVRAGRVRVVAAVADLDAAGAVLDDGVHVDADHVIAATGYRPGLEPLVGHLGVLDADGRPTALVPLTGLGFVGFRVPLTGTLWAIDRDARRVAATLTARREPVGDRRRYPFPMSTPAARERRRLADELVAVGPDAPTLCDGWTARDLAAHVVIRERRPDAAVGILVGALSGYTDKVQAKTADGDWDDLVDRMRTGPPLWSPTRVDKVDRAVNTIEFFVHTEDVRRAAEDWTPREIDAELENDLAAALERAAKMLTKSAPTGVTLAADGREPFVAHAGDPMVTVRGPIGELVLFVYGRQEHARVEFEGPDDAVAQLRTATFGI